MIKPRGQVSEQSSRRNRPSRITFTIRDEAPPNDAVVLLHLGADDRKAMSHKRENVLKHHDRWIDKFDDAGRFTISVYALIDVEERFVLEKMPHSRFGRSSVGDVLKAGFEMIPTSISVRGTSLIELQPYHYSIVLPTKGCETGLLAQREIDPSIIGAVEADLRQLIALFKPTEPNYAL
ncbi:MAG: hypothetical protein GY939_07440 [Actinomycetia bacterium]|nr:hypothetical protein [Actinomycetes bacterium]